MVSSSLAKRYQSLMKNWRRLRRMAEQEQKKQRKRLLEELRALDSEAPDDEWAWR